MIATCLLMAFIVAGLAGYYGWKNHKYTRRAESHWYGYSVNLLGEWKRHFEELAEYRPCFLRDVFANEKVLDIKAYVRDFEVRFGVETNLVVLPPIYDLAARPIHIEIVNVEKREVKSAIGISVKYVVSVGAFQKGRVSEVISTNCSIVIACSKQNQN